ncbi:ArsR family transcriptional regulator [Nocardia yamanashiensis]|uniref:helix-turn-helix transcriptional regulator n=1 Tax=Nocardia yamanashiensis TaxID=209247 RepID=UPI001E5F6FC9|nr:helix-turn-helix domain-containing protein [Nocardia yamanashiensis]UGT43043.1 ArsR family transcriptional regulator [Nocardia yamanashiensis]
MSIEAVALLQDPIRRRLYDYVAAADHEVSRDEAAAAAEIKRPLAAFHLDKLAEAGLLDAVFRRPEGKTGPGAGRPAKFYRRAAAEFAVTLPARDYATVASVLAEAVEHAGMDAAIAKAAAAQSPSLAGRDLLEVLRERGYEPYADGAVIRLRNCPFHRLAEDFPPLVCGMNLALLTGPAAEAGWQAHMDAAPGRCCVSFSKNNDN